MIHNKKNRILIMLLICIILINYIMIPKNANAEVLTLTAIYGAKVAADLITFIITCAVMGISYYSHEEAKKAMDAIHDNPTTWETKEYLEQTKKELDDAIWRVKYSGEPPINWKPPPGDRGELLKKFLVGGIVGGIVATIFDKYKTLFQGLGANEGDNIIVEDGLRYDFGDFYINAKALPIRQNVLGYIEASNGFETKEINVLNYGGGTITDFKLKELQIYSVNGKEVIFDIYFEWWANGNYRGISKSSNQLVMNYDKPVLETNLNISTGNTINYYVKPSSTIITNILPTTIPLPDITKLPNLQETISPEGEKKLIYPGTMDQLTDDIIQNTTFEDLQNMDNNPPWILKPTPNGVEIDILPNTTPYPTPTPGPLPGQYPNPNLPPGILPGQYPGPGPYPGIPPLPEPGILPGQYPGPAPYPDLPGYPSPELEPGILPGQYPGPGPYPGIEPLPEPGILPGQYPGPGPYPETPVDPTVPVEPGFQINYTPWLQIIINWLKLIYELPAKLFQIPEGLNLDTSKLRLNDYKNKFPFSIPWDIARAINVFAKSPSDPDLKIDINTDNLKVNEQIDLSKIDLPLRFARYVATIFFIIFLAGKTRDIIKW